MNVNRAIFILAVAVAAAGAGVIWQKESIPAPQAAVETAISQEKYDVVYSRDGTKAYIHGVWGYGYNGVERSAPLEQEPACGIRLPQEKHEKVTSLTIGELARITEVERDDCEQEDTKDLFYMFPNLKHITVEEGNPYLKMEGDKLCEIDSGSGKVRRVLAQLHTKEGRP